MFVSSQIKISQTQRCPFSQQIEGKKIPNPQEESKCENIKLKYFVKLANVKRNKRKKMFTIPPKFPPPSGNNNMEFKERLLHRISTGDDEHISNFAVQNLIDDFCEESNNKCMNNILSIIESNTQIKKNFKERIFKIHSFLEQQLKEGFEKKGNSINITVVNVIHEDFQYLSEWEAKHGPERLIIESFMKDIQKKGWGVNKTFDKYSYTVNINISLL